MKLIISLPSYLLLGIFIFLCQQVDAQYWPPNVDENGVSGKSGARSVRSAQIIPPQEAIPFFPVEDISLIKNSQQSFTIKAGLNRELGVAEQDFGGTLGNNFFVSISLNRRPLSLTPLQDFIGNLPPPYNDIPQPDEEFVFIQQRRFYYEPEIVFSRMEFDRFQTNFSLTYFEVFPSTIKYNFDKNLSVGAGAGFSVLTGVTENGESLNDLADNGYETVEGLGILKASYYFGSPWHLELRYIYRQARYARNRLPVNTVQLAIGYSIGGKLVTTKSSSSN